VLGSAYDENVNGIAKSFLEASGLKVVGMKGLSLVDNLVVGRLGPESSYDLGRAVDRPDADALVLSCTNWRTMDSIERLERDLGKPVISTSQASIWAALRIVGYIDSIPGYGRLMRELASAEQPQAA
jgi:maleate cis-trans isomerase